MTTTTLSAGRRLGALTGVAALAAAMSVLGQGPAAAFPGFTATPIKHVVVIFDENISFDHYFGTYPKAANISGETLEGSNSPAATFTADPSTPTDIRTFTHDNLAGAANPNIVKPLRLTPAQAVTCDQNHNYGPEQQAYNGGKADQFVQHTSVDECPSKGPNMYQASGLTMGYYDGNTVTGMWNYAQHYALSDNSFDTSFGPSTPGALNLVSGQTWGARSYDGTTGKPLATPDPYSIAAPGPNGVGTVIEDPDPVYDDCSNKNRTGTDATVDLQGRNIGDLLSARGVSWGWFQGGFRPTTAWTGKSGDYAKCATSHVNVAGNTLQDYSPHHNPFEYYKSTSNPHHLAPRNAEEIGHNGRANHQYDLTDFDTAVSRNNLPAVSYLKAAAYEDGHATNSDPIDEQRFVTQTINTLQQSKQWASTAVVLAYDDSDGWYDHVPAKILTGSNDPKNDASICTSALASAGLRDGHLDQCGPGTRQPLLVVSPYAKKNFIDHTATETASVLKFVEDNWHLGRVGGGSADARAGSIGAMFDFASRPRTDKLFLSDVNGSVQSAPPASSAGQNGTVPVQASEFESPGTSTDWWKIAIPVVVVVVLVGSGGFFWMRGRRAS